MTRRAYTLPLVLFISVALTLLVASTLERHGSSRLTAYRQVRAYTEYHTKYGVQAVIRSWWETVSNTEGGWDESDRPVEGAVTMPDGRRIGLRLVPAQGALPVGPAAGVDELFLEADLQLRRLGVGGTRMRREMGDRDVAILFAPPEVIEAIAKAAIDDDEAAEDFAREILQMRNDGDLTTRGDLTRAATAASVPAEDRQELLAPFVLQCTLYRLQATLSPPPGSADAEGVQRFVGWVDMTGGKDVTGSRPTVKVLTFDRVLPDEAFTVDGGVRRVN